MLLPTEPIGSISGPPGLVEALAERDGKDPGLDPRDAGAIRDTTGRRAAAGAPVVSAGEPGELHNVWTYCVYGPTKPLRGG